MAKKITGWVFLLATLLLIPLVDRAAETPSDPGISGTYLNVKGIIEFRVAYGFMKYYEFQLQQEEKVRDGDTSMVSVIQRLRADGFNYEIDYWLDADQSYHDQLTNLENLFRAVMFDSKLAKEGKINLLVMSDASSKKVRDVLDDAMALVFMEKNPNVSSDEVFDILKRLNFDYVANVDPAKAGVEKKLMPLVIFFDLSKSDKQTGSLANFYAQKAEKINWAKLDKVITTHK